MNLIIIFCMLIFVGLLFFPLYNQINRIINWIIGGSLVSQIKDNKRERDESQRFLDKNLKRAEKMSAELGDLVRENKQNKEKEESK